MNASLFLAAVLALVVLFWAVGAYQRLQRQRTQCRETITPIPAQLAQRHALIAPLAESAHTALKDERGLIEEAVASANAAMAATVELRRHPLDPAAAAGTAEAEQRLDGALAAVEKALSSAGAPAVTQVQLQLDQLVAAEEQIAVSCTVYNHAAARYNAARAQFPGVIIAFIFAFRPVGLLTFQTAASKPSPRTSS